MKFFVSTSLGLFALCTSLQPAVCASLTTNVLDSLQGPVPISNTATSPTPRRHLRFPAPKLISYPGMSESYNNARWQSALKEDAVLEMWSRGIKPEEFGIDDGQGGYVEPFRDHQLITESLQIMLTYWQAQSFADLSLEEMSQFQNDIERLSQTDVTNLVGKEWRHRGYKGDIFEIELAPLLDQSVVLPALEIIAGPKLRDQVRAQMIAAYNERRQHP